MQVGLVDYITVMARKIADGEEPKNKRIPVMMTASQVERIDRWRGSQSPIPSRGEAIRHLFEVGLSAEADDEAAEKKKST